MQELIQNEFVKTVQETMKRFAKELNTEEAFVQVFFGLDENGENVYKIFNNYVPYKTVGFTNNGILKGKIDFTGKSLFVPDGIKSVLNEFERENGMPKNQAGIMVINKEMEEHPFIFYLYNGTQPVTVVSFDEVFSKIKIG